MSASSSTAVDGRELVSVVFERQLPDGGAAAPCIEVVYEVIRPEGGVSPETVLVLNTLSITATDTRAPIFITQAEKDGAAEAAAAHLTNEIEEHGW